MRTPRLAAIAMLLATVGGSSSRVRALAPSNPAAEQIALIRIQPCEGSVGATEDGEPPLCSDFILMDADGTHVMPIPGGDDPAWSPDGNQLLVVRSNSCFNCSTATGDIFVSAVTSDTSVNLTNHPADDLTPAWSPDGSRIAFASDRDGPLDLYIMNADGSNVVRVGTGVGMAWKPTWSPDSTRLAFTCIVDPVPSPWWSATGDFDICVIDANGSRFARLTSEPGHDYSPAWSPDGARILFATERFGGFISTIWGDLPVSELAVMNTDGSGVTRLNPGTYAYDPRWSSDGARIAYVTLDPNTDRGWSPWNIVSIINADGTGLTGLALGRSPTWRPWVGGVNDRPVASFTVECVEGVCAFDALSSSDSDGTITQYGWQFGDGAVGSGATLSHTFPVGRSYRVQLVVMDDRGGLGASSQAIDLNQRPVVSLSATCSGLTCAFDGSASFDPDGTIAFFIWRFGDGRDGTGPATMAHTYLAAGTYIVTLTATDNSYGTGAQSQTVTVINVNAPPIASFTSSCSGLTCSFNASGSSDLDGTIASYAWSFGDAATGSGATVSHTYAAGGIYTASLTVTDNATATNTQAQSVTVAPPDIHVGDLNRASTVQQNTWSAAVTITTHDSAHGFVANAGVSGTWNDGSTATCITDARGQCAVVKSGILKKTTSVTFTVTNLMCATFVYKPTANHDANGDSNGTTVSVTKP